MNNTTFWIMVVPFAVSGLAYIGAGLGYQFFLNRPGMAVAMFSYTVSCIALVYDALTVGVK
jgi:hypothetical protein